MSTEVVSSTSLWLEPEGASRARFTALIRQLSRSLGTPTFEPHVTLLGGLTLAESEVVDRTVALAERIPPLELRLTRAGVGTDYYHFLYFDVAPTPELHAAHAAAREAFGLAPADYEPHLSLAYAIPAEHDPEQLLTRVPGRPWGRFKADSVTMVRTTGIPDEWEALGQLPLKG